ncbi:Hypothetical predicted protein [Mytilus galloprovincialis]|uniref:Ig-like domain-containing protein n=1 Tax=Mytilus galloprovincialis TaxID=29158 RepID=A0A8B6DQT7_MYTGA|nr:Hypothetical predicted protein [Mytilus galloprovincialis]
MLLAIIFYLLFRISNAEVTWNVSTRPIVLGKLVILTCDVEKLSGKFEHKKLQWIGKGQGQSEFLCYGSSGLCSNDNKYKVTIRNSSFDLEIQNFNVRDLDVVYTCAYGYDTFPKMLSWNTEKVLCKSFNIIDESDYRPENTHFNITLTEVYPKPFCSATSKSRNGTVLSESKVDVTTENSLVFPLKKAIISGDLQHGKVDLENCDRQVFIYCCLSMTLVTVLQKSDNVCSSLQETQDKGINPSFITAPIIVSGVCVLAIIMIIAIFVIRKGYLTTQQMRASQLEETKYLRTQETPVIDM